MKICKNHWDMCRKAIDDRGMTGLVGNQETVKEAIETELAGGEPKFDPLMSMNNHWWSAALDAGGLYLMGATPDGGEYCPVCEFEKHSKGFVAEEAIGSIADQMHDHCIANNLIARPS